MSKTSTWRQLLGAFAATCALLGGPLAELHAAEPPAASHPPRRGALTEREMEMARRAWVYFENNYKPQTGLVNAVNNYPSTTLWDTASYLGALTAARELGLIERAAYDQRLQTLLRTFERLDFFRGELPNKVYNTETAAKTDYGNQPGEIGYSALDLGRLLIWLKITKERHPEHADAIDRFVLRWDFSRMVDRRGTLFGAMLDGQGRTVYVQEGRLGYEEYAAKGFQLWGFDTAQASMPEPFATLDIFGVAVPHDSRDPRHYHQHNYVVSESYVLDALELNWDQALDRSRDDRRHSQCWMADFAQRVYQAQENRHRATGILTARTEHQLDKDPYFVYDTVFTDGYAWNTITESGRHVPEFAAVSLKAALGMWAIWQSPYTDRLFEAIADAHEPGKGYYEGLYENGSGPIRTQTANNNGIMLEALLFKAQGKLLQWGERDGGLWEATNADLSAPNPKNHPRFVRQAEGARAPSGRARPPAPRGPSAPRPPSCGSCSSCENTSFDYSPAWRSLPR